MSHLLPTGPFSAELLPKQLSQPVLLQWTLPSLEQWLVFVLDKPLKVPVGPFLHLVHVPLDRIIES